ncbi:la protein homolog [Chelonus insularis]|uniref:la protein homolog n=1 Tax=Chelonus insularis TaxID=460826 RepID=UPI00158F5559|nr:la protein homolog [Chelonus insularis]
MDSNSTVHVESNEISEAENHHTENGEVIAEKSKDESPVNEDNKTKNNDPLLLDKIQSQIEFYFGDVNMLRDKFLIEQTKLDEGWIPLSVLLQFNLLASLSTDTDVILNAVERSDLMEISEDRKKIRRRLDKPLPIYNEEYKKAQLARTVYMKPFPQTIGIQDLKNFLSEFGPIENIIMRKYKDENKKFQFKGSIFVQFKNITDAKQVVEKESVLYDGKEIIRKFSEDYTLEKNDERHNKKHKNDSKEHKKKDVETSDNEKIESDSHELPKGSVLHLQTTSNKILWEDIKKYFVDLGEKIIYVDYKNGSSSGWIRFQGTDSAKSILTKITDNKIQIKDFDVTCRLIEGDEEEQYLQKVQKELNSNKKFKNKKNRNKKGFKTNRKRSGSPISDNVASKKAAI